MPVVDPVYCPLCATRLAPRTAHGAERIACPACDFVHFEDPKVAVGVLVTNDQGELLYTKRNHDPLMGSWAFPGGFVDRGEDVRVAARREVQEETGLLVELDGLVDVYSRDGDPVVYLVFDAHPVGGRLQPGPEAQAVRFFAAAALPPSAFPFDREIVEAWKARRH